MSDTVPPASVLVVPAAATTIGSMPGVSVRESVARVVDVVADDDGVPHLPELPARGPGADLIGRTLGLLARIAPDLAGETTPSGWRFADAPGRETRRAWSWLGEDLDAWEEALPEFEGLTAASLAGPWTVAAAVELRTGERAVKDPGAARDLAAALAHVAVDYAGELHRRTPRARVSVWIDEPALPAVLHGEIPTASGLSRYAAVDEQLVAAALSPVVEALHGAGAAADRDIQADDARLQEVLRLRKENFDTHGDVRQLVPGRSWAAWSRALGLLLPPVGAAFLRWRRRVRVRATGGPAAW